MRYHDDEIETRTTWTRVLRIARKNRRGIRAGDLIARTTSFEYEVGGPRIGYGDAYEQVVLAADGSPTQHPDPERLMRDFGHRLNPAQRRALEDRIAQIRAVAEAARRELEAAVEARRIRDEDARRVMRTPYLGTVIVDGREYQALHFGQEVENINTPELIGVNIRHVRWVRNTATGEVRGLNQDYPYPNF